MKNITVHVPWERELILEKIVSDNYREKIKEARNIVIKAGTDVLLDEKGRLDLGVIDSLFSNMADYIQNSYRLTFVTSGAVAAGKECFSVEESKGVTDRGFAAYGQSLLMEKYNFFSRHYLGIPVAQGLAEKTHFYSNRRDASKEGIDDAYALGGIVVINANDPFWADELNGIPKKSDNDNLTRLVYRLIGADLAIYLTSADGLMYNYGMEDEKKIDLAIGITSKTRKLIKQINSESGTGGMDSKTKEIKKIMDDYRGMAVIANGKNPDVIKNLLQGYDEGTYFARKELVELS